MSGELRPIYAPMSAALQEQSAEIAQLKKVNSALLVALEWAEERITEHLGKDGHCWCADNPNGTTCDVCLDLQCLEASQAAIAIAEGKP